MVELNLKEKVKDVSFFNIFCRKIVIRLFVFFTVSILLFGTVQTTMIKNCNESIDYSLSETALSLAQLEESGMPDYMITTASNAILSNVVDELENNPFIISSSLSFYNLTKRTLISKSSQIPVLGSQEACDWWRQQSNVDAGIPTIFLGDEAMEFYNKFKDDIIYIDRMYCVNSVIFPSLLKAYNDDNVEIGEWETIAPASVEEYTKPTQLFMLGNDAENKIYNDMTEFLIEKTENPTKEISLLSDVHETAIVTYKNIDKTNVSIKSKTFRLNETIYQIDCGYQTSFWHGALWYIVAFEVIGILLCVASAFINTKETFAIYC